MRDSLLGKNEKSGLLTRREAVPGIGIFIILIVAVCKGEVNNVITPPATEAIAENESRERRKLIYNQFVEAARNVVAKTKDSEAAELLEFLNKNAIFAEPSDQGIKITENSTQTDQWVAIVILLSDDEPKGDHGKHIFSKKAAGEFLPSIRTLFLDGINTISSFTKGIILLHEVCHAKRWINFQYDWQDTQTFCMQEVATHELQNRITSKLGGKDYQDVLEEEVKRQFDILNAQHVQVGVGSVSRSPYDARLDKIFGPALSQIDKDFRQTSLWSHAAFVLIERYFEGDVENQKGLFLKTIYGKSGGILPAQQDK